MRILLTILLSSIALALPRGSEASTIEITIEEPLSVVFGLNTNASVSGDHFAGVRLDGVPIFAAGGGDFEGEMGLESGPLLNLTIAGINSRYEYGPGEILIPARWFDGHDFVEGLFSGTVLGLTIELCEQELAEAAGTDCGDVFGESLGTVAATLGAGAFDAAFARALHVAARTSGGSFFFFTDDVTGGPSDDFRIGGAGSGQGDVTITGVAVPEPSVVLLLTTSLLTAIGLRRSRVTAPRSGERGRRQLSPPPRVIAG